MRHRHAIALLLLLIALLTAGAVSAQEDLTTWFIYPFTTGGGVAATPTTTSSQLSVTIPGCQSKLIMGNATYNGVLLSDVLAITYNYNVSVAGASASFIYINLYLDTNTDGLNDTRLDFVPNGNTTGSRSHNALTDGSWSGGLLSAGSTWANVLATYPGAKIAQTTFGTPGYPSLVFNIGDTGCGWNGWSGVFYAPTITIAGTEPAPASADVAFQFTDGRINNRDAGAPIAAYGQDDASALIVYGIANGGAGYPALIVPAEAIATVPDAPDTNTLIAETSAGGLDIRFWRLTSGEFQINVARPDGKLYVLRFNALVPGGAGYTSFETP